MDGKKNVTFCETILAHIVYRSSTQGFREDVDAVCYETEQKLEINEQKSNW